MATGANASARRDSDRRERSAGSRRTRADAPASSFWIVFSLSWSSSRTLSGAPGRWSQRRDSNPQPADYKSAALPIEPRWPRAPRERIADGRTNLWPTQCPRGHSRRLLHRPRTTSGVERSEEDRDARGPVKRGGSKFGWKCPPAPFAPPHSVRSCSRWKSTAARTWSIESPPYFSRKASVSASATIASPTTEQAGTEVTSERW